MKTIIFDGDLSNENVQALIDDIEQPHADIVETDIVLYFSSNGGSRHSSQMLIDCVNRLPKDTIFKMIFYWQVHSAAFDVFVRARCTKVVYDGAISILHVMDRTVNSKDYLHNKKSFDAFLVEDVNDANEKYLEWLAGLPKFLTDKETRRISKGKDVYISNKRLRKLLKRLNK